MSREDSGSLVAKRLNSYRSFKGRNPWFNRILVVGFNPNEGTRRGCDLEVQAALEANQTLGGVSTPVTWEGNLHYIAVVSYITKASFSRLKIVAN